MCFWVSVLVLSGLQRFPIFPLLLLLCSFFPPFISGLSSPASLRWITMVTGSPLFSCLTATRSPDNRITQEAPCRTSRAPSWAPKHKMFLTAAANWAVLLNYRCLSVWFDQDDLNGRVWFDSWVRLIRLDLFGSLVQFAWFIWFIWFILSGLLLVVVLGFSLA